MKKDVLKSFVFILLLTIFASLVAIPASSPISFEVFGKKIETVIGSPFKNLELKKGLDIQGGTQVVLEADMSQIAQEDKQDAINSATDIILKRVDLYGVAEPKVRSLVSDQNYRIVVELAGIKDTNEALALVGQTAELSFFLIKQPKTDDTNATVSANTGYDFQPTELSGKSLKKASAQFDPQTGEPVVALDFNDEGRQIFAEITTNNTGDSLAIILDGQMVMAPQIKTPIVDGKAVITGGFNIEQAQQLSIQLNAGALPVPIKVLEQRTVDATLGADSVQKSVFAGLVGIFLVAVFMILYYGFKGFLAVIALVLYAIFTLAIYKLLGITLTLPGIAGMILSIGMAVDANILIFERMKEELRLEKPFEVALELCFGRAWDSIKDANLATIITALILINPLDFRFLNSGGMVRGFGVTLLIGVLLSLFTGVLVSRTLMRMFLKGSK